MKRSTFILLVFIVLLGIVNAFFLIFKKGNFEYANISGTFTFAEANFNGRDYRMCMNKLNEFKKTGQSDTTLYRLHKKNWLQVWRYAHYMFDTRYNLPYYEWADIENIRGTVNYKSGFQDF